MANRYCGNCGQELSLDDHFCPNCGRPVHETAQVSTPEADVNVPPPPGQEAQVGAGGASGAPPPAASEEGWRREHPILTGCLAIIGLLILLGIVGAAIGGGDETAGGGGGGGESPSGTSEGRSDTPDESQGSGETFTRENYAQLISDPDAYEGAQVDVTGQVFTAPEIVEGDTAFQMFADPKNGEWNTAVLVEGANQDLQMDDYVHVVGTVRGSMEGENAFGGTVNAVMVEASKVEAASGVEAVDPTQKTVDVGRTLTDQGFSITLKKIEFGEDTTRAYVAAYNGTNVGAYFYDSDAHIIQGSRQLDQETAFDYEVQAPQTDLGAGIRTDGITTFGKADPSKPLQVQFEWSSDNYDITPNPIVFEVTP